MKNNKEERRYRQLREAWDKIEKFFRKDYPAILIGVIFTAAIAFSILSYKQNKGKESFSVSKSSILGEKAGSISAVATTSARSAGSEEGPLVSSVSGTKTATKSNSVPSKSNYPININTADIPTLIELPDIGESRAKDIIEYRQRFGPFKNIRELMNIKGIKEGRFEKIKGLVTVGD